MRHHALASEHRERGRHMPYPMDVCNDACTCIHISTSIARIHTHTSNTEMATYRDCVIHASVSNDVSQNAGVLLEKESMYMDTYTRPQGPSIVTIR